MKIIIEKIINHEFLTEMEARQFILGIDQNEINEAQIAAVLMGIQLRGVQLEELSGFRSALLELCVPVELDVENAIDVCGTGGDGKDTFNISTTTAFVLAAMGIKVIKHGNYGVSSICGSSNVLEEIGVHFKTENNQLIQDLEKYNICFIHAPLFHPTLKKVANVRKNLGIRTVFNSLGPLVNPAQPKFQLTGTFSLELSRIYSHLLRGVRKDFRVIHGLDGFDEITLTNAARVLGKNSDYILDCTTFETKKVNQRDLTSGTSIQDAAKIMLDILKGEGTEIQNTVVASNVATALQMYHPESDLIDLFQEAMIFIKSGETIKRIKTIIHS